MIAKSLFVLLLSLSISEPLDGKVEVSRKEGLVDMESLQCTPCDLFLQENIQVLGNAPMFGTRRRKSAQEIALLGFKLSSEPFLSSSLYHAAITTIVRKKQ